MSLDKIWNEQHEAEYLEFFDRLRDSGKTNMFGAAPFLEDEFGVTIRQARAILSHWMKTYEARHQRGGSNEPA